MAELTEREEQSRAATEAAEQRLRDALAAQAEDKAEEDEATTGTTSALLQRVPFCFP